jgi:hypothetical protein
MVNGNFHFAMMAAHENETMEEAMIRSNYGSFYDLDAVKVFTQSQITQQLSKMLGPQAGIDYMMDLVNGRYGSFVKTLKDPKQLNAFITDTKFKGDVDVLRYALYSIYNTKRKEMSEEDALKITASLLGQSIRLYKGSHRMVVAALDLDKGTFKALNARNNLAAIKNLVKNHVNRLVGDARSLDMIRKWEGIGSTTATYRQNLQALTGLPMGILTGLTNDQLQIAANGIMKTINSEEFMKTTDLFKRAELLYDAILGVDMTPEQRKKKGEVTQAGFLELAMLKSLGGGH